MVATIAVEQHPTECEGGEEKQALEDAEGRHAPRTRQRGFGCTLQLRRAVAASSAVTG
jgi:hypothetical protein